MAYRKEYRADLDGGDAARRREIGVDGWMDGEEWEDKEFGVWMCGLVLHTGSSSVYA